MEDWFFIHLKNYFSSYVEHKFYPTCNYQNTEIAFGGPEEN